MKKFEMNKLQNDYTLLVTLLSFQSPFDFFDCLENEVSKHLKSGNVILDEYAHNNSEDKRFISFVVSNGKICKNTLAFEMISEDDIIYRKSNTVLIKNKSKLIEQGVDLDNITASY